MRDDRNIKNWNEFLNEDRAKEDYDDGHQERFDRAIYLTFVDSDNDQQYKHLSKAEFEKKLRHRLDTIKSIDYDKKNIYRLADEKLYWLDKNKRTLGIIYKEDNIESHWINTELKKY